jgi:signal transduction histidine kinase
MVKRFFDTIATRKRLGFFAAFFLLLLSYILTFISTRKVSQQDHLLNHTNEVIHNLDNIMGFITRSESAFRGYLITKDTKLLSSYHESITSTDSTFKNLKHLAAKSKNQLKNIDTLDDLVDQKFAWIDKIISSFASTHKIPPSILEQNSEGILKSRNIQIEIDKMKREEMSDWNARSQSVSQYPGLIQILNILSIVIAIVLTFYSLIVYNKENKEKRDASKKAEEYKEELQERVKQLAKLNTELIELRRLEKYVVTGRIARVIAHEVRNPLTNINLACEQLQSEIKADESTQMLFTMISRNSERINQLVSDLLNTTRVAELTFSEASINKVLDASIGLALDRIELNQIKVIKNYDETIPPLSIDIEKIKIAFLNIIVNAVEAIGENGTLKISTENKNDQYVVKISDNGNGMSRAQMDRLFEPYFTTKEKGNGLGLANSQNIILGHKGSISAESEQGKGTTFTIILNK